MHLARMEFYGYHVFNDNYNDLTPEQAVFIDMGVSKMYNTLFGGDEKDKQKLSKLRGKGIRHRKHF